MIPFEEAVISASKKLVPSVVHVNTLQIADYYFQKVPVQGVGSGVIADSGGYILTNAHVVSGAERLEITLDDGRKFAGKVVGADEMFDIAVVKISAKNLPVPKFGDSDALQTGQVVIAIGNPLGLAGGPTVTVGVISSVNRSIQTEQGMVEGLIQTDAAINPGNSGGPLVDSEGRVIGMSTAMIPYAQGIGFAIPINIAMKILEDVVKYGEVRRPWIGISGIDITKKVVAYYNLPTENGIIVMNVMPKSPAGRSGIRRGDILVAVNGKRIGTMQDLIREMWKIGIGKKIKLEIIRSDKKLEIEAKLESVNG